MFVFLIRLALFHSLFAVIGLIVGCSGQASDQPDLGRVTGRVLMDNEPLAGYTITYTPSTGRPAFSVIDSDGQYDLNYIRNTKGAKVGPNKVTVTWVDFGGGSDGGDPPVKKIKIPKRYSTESELSVDVKPGANTFDFDLNSK
ncbi:carboxypeptidase regulatory-like domain-containing protein [Blastopirellula sp. J2-11]|uniref:carboxypeptidase regulatory-like domain-containing protein n=1 Tax=Blastopirellula sp. J2-11 TaxID=2943192 RepID=UPI0021C61446|nr:carboxypeptidase regulatory-like domain-containing protein [Blastopirellula sp. J2-11]UUO07742.1 carboxypeptidase regulatory-like domain-containing protein [Blastopirellula sp. J2-11]